MSSLVVTLYRFRVLAVLAVLFLGAVGATIVTGDVAGAVNSKRDLCIGSGGTWNGRSCTNPDDDRSAEDIIETVTNIFLLLVGAASVIMIVVGGFMYTVSAGDQTAAAKAKNTILYAVVGLVIAFAGYAVSDFVIDAFTSSRIETPAGGDRLE